MSIKMITQCKGKENCTVFRTPEALLQTLNLRPDFANMMTAIEIIKKWRVSSTCPFKVKMSTLGDREHLRRAICSLASRPPFSMDAVSRGTGYSKTRVAQIEYTALRKARRALGRAAIETEVLDRV